MITAGCDVGSLTAKAVLIENNKILSTSVLRVASSPENSAIEAMNLALNMINSRISDIGFCVGTGYGKDHIPFANSIESEISCHARGAVWQLPSARVVIDIGGQDAKVIKIDESGKVLRFMYNDKCAAGTGRFLEVIADALDIALEDLGTVSSGSQKHLSLSNQCVVFAETEIISLVNEGAEISDIISALHRAVANRAASLANSIDCEGDTVMTGGVAINSGMFSALGDALGLKLHRVENPQINGALGAALIAADLINFSNKNGGTA